MSTMTTSWFERAQEAQVPTAPSARSVHAPAPIRALADLPTFSEPASYPSGIVREVRAALPVWAAECGACDGVGWVAAHGGPFGYDATEPCSRCGQAHRVVDLLKRAGLPAAAADRELSAMDWTRFGAHPRQTIWDVLQGVGSPAGLLLSGTTGAGKTHISWGMVLHEVLAGRPARWVHWPRLLADQKALFGVGDADGNRRDLIAELGEFRGLLALDEIGMGMGTDWAQGELYRLLDLRLQMSQGVAPLVVTTNAAGMAFRQALGDRQVSRLFELCRVLLLDAEDYRQERHGEPGLPPAGTQTGQPRRPRDALRRGRGPVETVASREVYRETVRRFDGTWTSVLGPSTTRGGPLAEDADV